MSLHDAHWQHMDNLDRLGMRPCVLEEGELIDVPMREVKLNATLKEEEFYLQVHEGVIVRVIPYGSLLWRQA